MAGAHPAVRPDRRHVAFLRAINVGGRYVKMERLRTVCAEAGLANVTTFITSGNVIFESRKPPQQLESLIEARLQASLGFEVATMVRSVEDLAAIARYVETEGLGAGRDETLYVGFLKTAPSRAAAEGVRSLSNAVDTLSVRGRELYWIVRTSFAESTVTGGRLEKSLQVPATLRNFNTVRRLCERFR